MLAPVLTDTLTAITFRLATYKVIPLWFPI